jgi:uncharacterized protein YdbL (DUF1318 family)
MTMAKQQRTLIREAVGVFHSAQQLECAVEALEENGFDRAEISLLASQEAVREKLGHHFYDAKSLEDDPKVPRTAFVSTASVGDAEGALIGGLTYVGALAAAGAVVASGGALAMTLAAAMTGGASGGLIGGLLAGIVGEQHAAALQRQLERGGLLVWVRTATEAEEARACKVLAGNGGEDVHVHTIEA